MKRIGLVGAIVLGSVMNAGQVHAIPGQSPDNAASWIRANRTLQPAPGERLLVRRSDSPAQRFTFQALPLKVGRATAGPNGGVIRTEEISFYDGLNGINRDRLEEALRAIYGPIVYQDFAQARVVYAYPQSDELAQAVNRKTPILAALQGEVREGDQYAYWLEIAARPDGFAYTGRLTVFLKADLPKLAAELQQR